LAVLEAIFNWTAKGAIRLAGTANWISADILYRPGREGMLAAVRFLTVAAR
jgi:hypothetical protein